MLRFLGAVRQVQQTWLHLCDCAYFGSQWLSIRDFLTRIGLAEYEPYERISSCLLHPYASDHVCRMVHLRRVRPTYDNLEPCLILKLAGLRFSANACNGRSTKHDNEPASSSLRLSRCETEKEPILRPAQSSVASFPTIVRTSSSTSTIPCTLP